MSEITPELIELVKEYHELDEAGQLEFLEQFPDMYETLEVLTVNPKDKPIAPYSTRLNQKWFGARDPDEMIEHLSDPEEYPEFQDLEIINYDGDLRARKRGSGERFKPLLEKRTTGMGTDVGEWGLDVTDGAVDMGIGTAAGFAGGAGATVGAFTPVPGGAMAGGALAGGLVAGAGELGRQTIGNITGARSGYNLKDAGTDAMLNALAGPLLGNSFTKGQLSKLGSRLFNDPKVRQKMGHGMGPHLPYERMSPQAQEAVKLAADAKAKQDTKGLVQRGVGAAWRGGPRNLSNRLMGRSSEQLRKAMANYPRTIDYMQQAKNNVNFVNDKIVDMTKTVGKRLSDVEKNLSEKFFKSQNLEGYDINVRAAVTPLRQYVEALEAKAVTHPNLRSEAKEARAILTDIYGGDLKGVSTNVTENTIGTKIKPKQGTVKKFTADGSGDAPVYSRNPSDEIEGVYDRKLDGYVPKSNVKLREKKATVGYQPNGPLVEKITTKTPVYNSTIPQNYNVKDAWELSRKLHMIAGQKGIGQGDKVRRVTGQVATDMARLAQEGSKRLDKSIDDAVMRAGANKGPKFIGPPTGNSKGETKSALSEKWRDIKIARKTLGHLKEASDGIVDENSAKKMVQTLADIRRQAAKKAGTMTNTYNFDKRYGLGLKEYADKVEGVSLLAAPSSLNFEGYGLGVPQLKTTPIGKGAKAILGLAGGAFGLGGGSGYGGMAGGGLGAGAGVVAGYNIGNALDAYASSPTGYRHFVKGLRAIEGTGNFIGGKPGQIGARTTLLQDATKEDLGDGADFTKTKIQSYLENSDK